MPRETSPFPTDSEQSLANLKLLVASELSVRVRSFIQRVLNNDAKNSKKLGWDAFVDMLPICDEFSARNWLMIFSELKRRDGLYSFFSTHSQEEIALCASCSTKKLPANVDICHAVEMNIKPWLNPSIYLPYLQAILSGVQTMYSEGSSDILGETSWKKGARLPSEKSRASGLFNLMSQKAKRETIDEGKKTQAERISRKIRAGKHQTEK